MPDSSAIIGKIAVKVIPDTDKFKDDLKDQLNKIERQLKAENYSVKVLVELDGSKIREQAKAIRTQAQAELKDMKIGVKVEGEESFQASLARMEAELAAMSDIDWKATFKPEVSEPEKKKAQATLRLLARDRTVNLRVVTNTKAVSNLTEALSRLSGFRDGHQFVADLKEMLFNLDLAIPKIGSVATGIGGIGAAALSGSAYLFALSASLAAIGAGALALPGIFGGLAIGLIATSVVLKDFNQQFSELRVGLGRKQTAGSWWKELQDQMSSNFWNIAKKPLQEMVYTLFPLLGAGLKDTSIALGGWFSGLATGLKNALGPRMQGMFADLNKSINIATGSTGALAQSIGVLGTLGASYLPRLAQWFTNLANKTADWLTEAERTGLLKELVDHAIVELKALWDVLVNVVGVLVDISRAAQKALGGDALQQLAKGLKRLHTVTKSADFQANLVDVFTQANSAMRAIVQYAGPALGEAIKNLGKLARDNFRDIGITIGELAGGIGDAFNNPRLQTSISSFFNTLRDFAINLRPAWDAVGEAIGSVLELIDTFINTASPGVARAIENLAGWISTLADGLQPIVEGLGGVLNDTLDLIAPAITRIVDAISAFASGDGGQALIGFFEDLKPLVTDISNWIGDLFTQLSTWANTNLPKIRDNLKPVIEDFQKFFKDHGQQMIDMIKGIGDAIVTLTGYLSDLSPAVADLVAIGALLMLGIRFTGLGKALTAASIAANGFPLLRLLLLLGALDLWSDKVNDRQNGKDGPSAIEQFFFGPGGWDAVKQKFNDAMGFLEGIPKWFDDHGFSGGPGLIHDLLFGKDDNELPNGKKGSGAAPYKEEYDNGWGGKPPWETAPSAYHNTLGTITAQTAEFRTTNAGQWNEIWNDTSTSFGRGTTEVIPKHQGFLGGLLKGLTDWIPGMGSNWSNLWQGLKDTGSSLWGQIEGLFGIHNDNMNAGAKKGLGDIDWSTSLGWGQVQTNTGSALSRLGEIVTGGFNNLEPGTKAGLKALYQRTGEIPGGIAAALGDMRNLLYTAGQDVVNGMSNGIASKISAVVDVGKRMAQQVASTVKSTLAIASPSRVMMELGVHTVNGFIVGLESRYDAVKDSLGGLADDVAATPLTVNSQGLSGRLSGLANGSLSEQAVNAKILNYYAAPGSSISAEEDLFAAGNRARMGW